MSNVIQFQPRKKLADKLKGVALCANNHHKWELSKSQRFDTMQGKLVTVEKCVRCGRLRNKLT